jgi:hypothetical protein
MLSRVIYRNDSGAYSVLFNQKPANSNHYLTSLLRNETSTLSQTFIANRETELQMIFNMFKESEK